MRGYRWERRVTDGMAYARATLARLRGIMLGRAAYHSPWLLADADRRLFGLGPAQTSRRDVVRRYCAYAEGGNTSRKPS